MIPLPLSPITSGVAGASAPAAGGISSPANAGAFTTQLNSLSTELGSQSIPLTGGVSQTATSQSASAATAISSHSANTIAEPTNWGHLAQQMISDVNQKQQVAGHLVRDVLAGGPTPVHQALIATEEASVSFQMLSEVRNKVVEAYQEVMRMSV